MVNKIENKKKLVLNDFDELEELAIQAKLRAKEAAKEPSYNQQQLAEARQMAFEKGKEEGIRETLANQDERIADALQALIVNIDSLASQQSGFESVQEKETIILAVNIAKRFLPTVLDHDREQLLLKFVHDAVRENILSYTITISIHPDNIDRFEQLFLDMVKEMGFENKTEVKPDPKLSLSDCAVKWDHGGAERILSRLWNDLDKNVKAFLNLDEIPDLNNQGVEEMKPPENEIHENDVIINDTNNNDANSLTNGEEENDR
jgi:flagellar biosynthesis/type III secretory pathway protein FliH